jgi:hypothetical protein
VSPHRESQEYILSFGDVTRLVLKKAEASVKNGAELEVLQMQAA